MVFSSGQSLSNLAVSRHSETEIGQDLVSRFEEKIMPDKSRSQKGCVSVGEFKGRLRLRWSYQGKRYSLGMGLPEGKVNRLVAEGKAKLIEQDIATSNFDYTLERYQPEHLQQTKQIKVFELFDQFTLFKSNNLESESLQSKYPGLSGYLRQYFRGKDARSIGEAEAFKFRDWLAPKLAPITLRERIGMLKSCWNWALKRRLVNQNPWLDVKVKVPPRRKNPFTKDEIQRILERVRAEPYGHYADFVEVLLHTGCRPGEAAGLRWGHLNEDCSVLWVGESWGRGRRKSTKTNKERTFKLSPRLQGLLLRRRSPDVQDEDLIFLSLKGCPVSDHNFRSRVWQPLLQELGITYRKPYNLRHSFAVHAIDAGTSPGDICSITGHTEETLFRSYLGGVRGRPTLPELFD
jgi:integrase